MEQRRTATLRTVIAKTHRCHAPLFILSASSTTPLGVPPLARGNHVGRLQWHPWSLRACALPATCTGTPLISRASRSSARSVQITGGTEPQSTVLNLLFVAPGMLSLRHHRCADDLLPRRQCRADTFAHSDSGSLVVSRRTTLGLSLGLNADSLPLSATGSECGT